MSLRNVAAKAADHLLPLPMRAALHRRRFFGAREWRNLHWGVFDSFEAANAFAQQHGAPPRFDMDQRRWLSDRQKLLAHDYPMLFWLERLFTSDEGRQFTRLCDLGGSVGVSYMALGPYLSLPPQLQWEVCELPEVADFGRQVARERELGPQLGFSSDLDAALDGADVLFTAGAIQYIDRPLEQMLGSAGRAPRHVFINRLPLTGGSSFVTLQNSGLAIHPYRIRNDAQFVDALSGIGWGVVDRWTCLQNSTHIPLHPERTLDHFHGFYLRRD
ncbi:methyltransferase, TIGR04325 family [Variovorax sp. OV329]|uniref:methyltransferase, TIGR04325 family n=1 Tax=Variovorax sp. OV329 TaxID=1882825 RepID=UPI0008EAD1A8|nr:methyltransferase, TIGR04325 family [Variovorax sp. OV329]SFM29101.1 putative methyltransferase, LIC12133 family [Variovorax sp. OV329]